MGACAQDACAAMHCSVARRLSLTLAPYAAALLLGLVFSCGFAPISLSGAAWAALAAALALAAVQKAPRSSAFVMLAFALSWFASSLTWTAASMTEHGRLPEALAAAGVGALAFICALFSAAAVWLTAKLPLRKPLRPVAMACGMAFAEYLRGAGFVDFGWSTPALAFLELPLSGYAPVGGGHLVNLTGLLSAGFVAGGVFWAAERRLRPAVGALAIAAVIWAAGAGLSTHAWSSLGPSVAVRMVQADLPVVDAFTHADPAERLAAATKLIRRPWPESAYGPSRILLAPEGLLNGTLSGFEPRVMAALGEFLDEARAPVLFNAFRHPAPQDWRNAAFLLEDGRAVAYVDKRKLVPFGEYVPAGFRWFVNLLGVPLADLTAGPADQSNLDLGNVRAGVLICYENLDGEVLRTLWKDPEGSPGMLFVTANLGWFSPQIIPQHLDMTRLRAMESARPAASVNMNGLSAVVNAKGEIVQKAPASGRAVLDVQIESAQGKPTPYVRIGDVPAAALSLVVLVLLSFFGRTSRRS